MIPKLRFLLILLMLNTWIVPAWAEDEEGPPDPIEAAATANEVNQVYCGEAWTRDIDVAASSTMRVVEAWAAVDEAYRANEEGDEDVSFLLFWRGVLAQCLRRDEEAHDDLSAFIEAQEETGGFADMVRQAKVRLRRLGQTKDLGEGPAAKFLHPPLLLEGTFAYNGGIYVQLQACTDSHQTGHINGGCIGPQTVWKRAAVGQPAGATAQVLFYPVQINKKQSFSLGVGARYMFGATTVSNLGTEEESSSSGSSGASDDGSDEAETEPYPETEIGPTWSLMAGVPIRIQKLASSGSAGARFQVMPGLWLRHERISPWAGNVVGGDQDLLHAGTWGWTLPGVGGWFEIAWEVRRAVALRAGGVGGATFPKTDPSLTKVANPSELVEIMPDATELTSMFAGGQFGLLIVIPNTTLALAPMINVIWYGSKLSYPNDLGDRKDGAWGDAWIPGSSTELRKVYSTRQDLLTVTFDLGIRFGVAAKKAK